MRAIVPGASGPRLTAGVGCGIAAGLLLLLVRTQPGGGEAMLVDVDPAGLEIALQLLLSGLFGAALAVLMPDPGRSPAATTTIGVLAGLGWWTIGSLTLSPLLAGDVPSWQIDAAVEATPALVGNLLQGGLTGIALAVAARLLPERAPAGTAPPGVRVLVLGGGFGGVACAGKLERLFARDRSVEVTLVSASNSLLFTPMLAEVASSALEPRHISAPVRAACPRTRFRHARVRSIDLAGRTVSIESEHGEELLGFDQLVIALGSEPTYRGLPGLAEHALPLKTLSDATRLREHTLRMLELAEVEQDPQRLASLLTFVVVGAGFAGTETLAELVDLVHNVLRHYPHVPDERLRFLLVHSGERILPELGPELAAYAQERLAARGVEFALGTRLAGATADAMTLADGRVVPTRTLVWTAGNAPVPALASLACERSQGGAVLVDPALRVPGWEGVWALGDCAQIPDPANEGGFYPPTAQHAMREGKQAAINIARTLAGREPEPFRFTTLGLLVGLGQRTAAAEIAGRRFSGLAAWLLWRAIYWMKLPGAEKKLRVLFDWTLDLVFPRDIVLEGEPRRPSSRTKEESGDA